MGESRTELLAWLNDILQLRYTKIEQAGTGTYILFMQKKKKINKNHRCCLLPTI
jgi:hypothetical protein